jgi:hypothetical protein
VIRSLSMHAAKLGPPLLLAALALALTGCGGDETEASTGASGPKLPTPYEPAPPPETPPAYDAAAVTAALPSALGLLATIDPDHLRALYEDFMALGDGVCPLPSEYPNDDGFGTTKYWSADCTTGDGTRFVGGAYLIAYQDRDNGDGTFTDGFILYPDSTDASVVAADGRSFVLTGYLEADVIRGGTTTEPYSYAAVYFDGSVVVDEATAAGDPWVNGERKGLVSIGGYADSYGTRTLDVVAGLSLGEGEFVAAATAAMSLSSGLVCPSEPAGGFSLRDAQGTWYDMVFDGNPPDEETPAGACDGCGLVFAGGRELGPSCPAAGAFDALLDYEVTPW